MSLYHLAGVAGVGMNALAQALLAAHHQVSGSDRGVDAGQDLDVIRKLAGMGVRIVPQDGDGITSATEALVVSTAIEADNPDVVAARRLGTPVRHRADVLASLAEGRRGVAITGTSGKSTVTGMVGWILECAGRDPTVVNGAVVLNWQTPHTVGNVRSGGSDLWVVEADESDRSLLRFHPDWAVITNVSRDHFTLDETRALFDQFARQVRLGLVTPRDRPADWGRRMPLVSSGGSSFSYGGVEIQVPLPGAHNAENAWFAVAVCERLGVAPATAAAALRTFRGIHRRLEMVGRVRDMVVIDDYAHNPAKLRAACLAVRPEAGRLLAIWRPHGFGPLRAMRDELVDTFASVLRGDSGDRLFLLPVYDAGGTADRSITSDDLAAGLEGRGVRVGRVADYRATVDCVVADARPGDTVLVMGARDPFLPDLGRQLLAGLSAGV